ncbi:Helix-turn-helix domain-containing protein [Draconibacterium orientale]|uniref:DNA-binding protein n=1 Tax=Draconibacterium orientale TaxID=1168034 RepID=X5DGK6_9BACT|nr:helix-turn-helix domain-containing protein [Draconibacterium orientale]AHW59582.1 DNA-binding protein [Draconibacterium orientale]SES84076.1 Helix-turn-helix domain-containing protein [Draconibacterium orientale]
MRDNYLQFIQVTPEQLQQAILKGVKEQLEELKESFQPKEPTEFLTRNEVKDMLKVDLTTIWNYTNKGKLKAYGIGNRVYYKRSEVEAAIKPLND